jgi:hypothetical protein
MRLKERLQRLDAAVLPEQRRYDVRQPVWFARGPVLGSALGVLLVTAAFRAARPIWLAVTLLSVVLAATLLVGTFRWHRRHRVA